MAFWCSPPFPYVLWKRKVRSMMSSSTTSYTAAVGDVAGAPSAVDPNRIEREQFRQSIAAMYELIQKACTEMEKKGKSYDKKDRLILFIHDHHQNDHFRGGETHDTERSIRIKQEIDKKTLLDKHMVENVHGEWRRLPQYLSEGLKKAKDRRLAHEFMDDLDFRFCAALGEFIREECGVPVEAIRKIDMHLTQDGQSLQQSDQHQATSNGFLLSDEVSITYTAVSANTDEKLEIAKSETKNLCHREYESVACRDESLSERVGVRTYMRTKDIELGWLVSEVCTGMRTIVKNTQTLGLGLSLEELGLSEQTSLNSIAPPSTSNTTT